MSPLELSKAFPDKEISLKLTKILTRWKIPLIETGTENGTHRLVSVFYGIFMSILVASYLAMMWFSKEFSITESSLVSTFALLSLLTYVCAVYVKPRYAELPFRRSDSEFLELLRRISHQNKKVCAYC